MYTASIRKPKMCNPRCFVAGQRILKNAAINTGTRHELFGSSRDSPEIPRTLWGKSPSWKVYPRLGTQKKPGGAIVRFCCVRFIGPPPERMRLRTELDVCGPTLSGT